MALNPKITIEGSTAYLNWTPDPTAEGYAFVTPGGQSRTFDPTLSRTKLGRNLPQPIVASVAVLDVTSRVAETATYPSAPPPPPPPPNAVAPGQLAAAINSAAPGSTLTLAPGQHPKLTLSRSFSQSAPLTLIWSAGATIAGVDTNSQSWYTFVDIVSEIPVEVNDYNISPFYLHGTSQGIKLLGRTRLHGGFDAIKVYGGSRDCVFDDQGLGSDLSGYGGDGIHINGTYNMRIPSLGIGSPWQGGDTPEHNDGIHAQAFDGLYIGPGVRIAALGPRADNDSSGMFLNKSTDNFPYCRNLEVDRPDIHWQIGRGMQVMVIDGTVKITTPNIYDSGVIGSSPKITASIRSGQHFDFYGVARSDVYFNEGSQYATFH